MTYAQCEVSMSDESIGSKLLRLKERSGLTLNNIARAGGYSSASSLQRYFSAEYDPAHLPKSLADRLYEAFVGFGDPPITHSDIEELTETGFYLKRQPRPHVSLKRVDLSYISCHPSYALGDDAYDNIAIELMAISEEEEVRRFNKPAGYGYRHIHATYVTASSMMPRYQPGEIIFYETDRPPAIGTDVIVCLQVEDRDAVYALGRLTTQSASHVELLTLSPANRSVIDKAHIQMMHPILSAADILGEYAMSG